MSSTRGPRTGLRPVALAIAAILAIPAVLGLHLLGAGAAPTPGDAPAALDWLVDELADGGHHLEHLGSTDWGLTVDVALAALAGGRGPDPDVVATVDAALAGLDAYSTWDDLGAAFSGVRLAGPTAKTLLMAELAGRPSATTDPIEAELRSLVAAVGPEAGRFADRNPHSPDASNGFGQAYGVLALARTATGAPAATVSFLLAQQCPSGAFRLTYSPAGGCTADGQADSDATALAVEALLAIPRTPAVGQALTRAVGWALSVQDPLTGAFGGTGPTAAPNANSTALLAQVLRAAGQVAPADAAAGWVANLQLATGGAGMASGDVGAIAYDATALAAAVSGGVTDLSRDQWRRSTAQAVLALGLPVLGSVDGPAPLPVDPPGGPSTTSTSGPSTSAPTSTSSTPTSSTTTTTSSTTTSSTSTTSTTIATGTSSATIERDVLGASAEQSGTSVSSGSAAGLPTTGTDAAPLIIAGVVLLAAGGTAIVVAQVARRRRR